MTAPVLVTGASGLIGRHVVARLLAAGRPVRVLVRERSRLEPGVGGRVCVVDGDLRNPRALARAVEGAGTILHLAACARAWSRDPEEFAAVNVQAVGSLLDAAADAGVERFVHVSTVLTLPGLRPEGWQSSRRLTPYEETKLIGERLVDGYAAMGRHAVVVHPTRVYGPGPLNDANGVTRLVALYLSSPVVLRLNDGDVLANYVHAGDVAEGILLAGERGRSGRHYVLGGENSSLRGVLHLVGELSGIRRRTLAVPLTAALAAAHAAVLWGHLGGRAPITPAWMRSYFDDQRVDVTPSCRELGYHYRPLREGLQETIAWLRQRLPAAS
jgi:nucleoside-diphosphate-sugar epimerase